MPGTNFHMQKRRICEEEKSAVIPPWGAGKENGERVRMIQVSILQTGFLTFSLTNMFKLESRDGEATASRSTGPNTLPP